MADRTLDRDAHAGSAGPGELEGARQGPQEFERSVAPRREADFAGDAAAAQVEVERHPHRRDARIEARVDRMIEAGWIDECRTLRSDPRGLSQEASQAIGYRQILEWLEREEPEPVGELVTGIKTATRRFARKQLTWIRRLKDAQTLHRSVGPDPAECVERVLEALAG
ncbi:MAG: hypothetical protein IID55_08965 [Proteobacteria bacterium]|nr:hypothetical protein [Pseudomonadota bacterium]